jgi:hypothetical protein
MHEASEAIYALKPVSFRYHKQYDEAQRLAFGLIAEEVAEVAPALVGRKGIDYHSVEERRSSPCRWARRARFKNPKSDRST